MGMANVCEKCNHKHICGFQDDETLACNHFQKEVVRCKDCKYEEECIHRIKFLSINKKPELCTAEYHPLDFCSYGERREDNGKSTSIE